MDHHTVASVSIAGSCLDVLGSLYLAYDLLGGQNGPLRLLTRAVTYSIVFGVGYGLGLGWVFGVASGTATGVTVAIELARMARKQDHYSLFWEGVFSAIRGLAFGAGLYVLVGFRFAAAFAILITIGTDLRVFARHTSGLRLWRLAPPKPDASTIRGGGGEDDRLHYGRHGMQCVRAAPGTSLDSCAAGWDCNGDCYRRWKCDGSVH